jgi:hypothetical protein
VLRVSPRSCRARARELRVKNHLSLDELAEHLALPKTTIYYWIKDLPLGRDRREQRKSNSGQLRGRTWRSEHGVLTVCVNDTALRARLQGWIELVRDDWH